MREKSSLTIDLSQDQHRHLKMACAKIGVSMEEFILQLLSEKMEDVEDEFLADMATETLENIRSGKERLIPWEEAKKRLSA